MRLKPRPEGMKMGRAQQTLRPQRRQDEECSWLERFIAGQARQVAQLAPVALRGASRISQTNAAAARAAFASMLASDWLSSPACAYENPDASVERGCEKGIANLSPGRCSEGA